MVNTIQLFNQYYNDYCKLCYNISESKFKPDCIIAICRGGSILGTHLSHTLGAPVEFITWQTRDGIAKNAVLLATVIENYNNVLIVDDISDTGITFDEIYKALYHIKGTKNIKSAALVLRETSKFTTDYYGRIEKTNDWINFWWEK